MLRAKIDKRGFFEDPKPLFEAIETLRAHVNRMPVAVNARFLLGYNLLFTGRAKEAIPHLEACVAAWPWDSVSRQALQAARTREGS